VLHDEITNKIKIQISDIDTEISDVSELLNKVKTSDPDKIELKALATVLHSFYNGIEKIFSIIAKDVDNDFPDDSFWHRKLIKQMNSKTNNREKVISDKLLEKLDGYLAFRHYYRHSYSFYLDWNLIKDLVNDIENTKTSFNTEISNFIKNQ